ncbi:unnamed protein product [Caenorhabditis nigoni]
MVQKNQNKELPKKSVTFGNVSTKCFNTEVEMQFTRNRSGEQILDVQEDKQAAKTTSREHCRHCKGNDHWSRHCPYKVMNQLDKEADANQDADSKNALRVDRRQMNRNSYDGNTCRVMNLPEDINEDKLRVVFGRIGRVIRIFIASDDVTGLPNGLAFVTYESEDDVTRAINMLNNTRMSRSAKISDLCEYCRLIGPGKCLRDIKCVPDCDVDSIKKEWELRGKLTKVLVLGLDGAGKTSIVSKFLDKESNEMNNKHPLKVYDKSFDGLNLVFSVVKGSECYRRLWSDFLKTSDAVIWVVDSSDRERLYESCRELEKVLERFPDGLLLVLANKSDVPNSMNAECIAQFLKLQSTKRPHHWKIFSCNAKFYECLVPAITWMCKTLKLTRLPGIIAIDVNVRKPVATHKEDWTSCTKAALAGGVSTILAMPNTNPPLVDSDSYHLTEQLASAKSVVDYALYIGATPENSKFAAEFSEKAAALKMYLNETFSTLKMDNISDWTAHFQAFPANRPIVCHAERQTLAAVLCIAQMANRAVHIAHVATADEIGLIRQAKLKGWKVTCDVCPHHLLLTDESLPEGIREVRPRLVKPEDRQALWDNLEYIDCFATDHAPHTWDEKSGKSGAKVPSGFPGVEYMLPLLLTAVHEGKLALKDVTDRLSVNPRRIFNLPAQDDTYIEVDMGEEWTIPENGGQSKAGWTLFAGRKVHGKVHNVVIRGEEAFVDGRIVATPGFGKNLGLYPHSTSSAHLDHDDELAPTLEPVSENSSDEHSPLHTPPRAHSPIAFPGELLAKNCISVKNLDKGQINRIFELADRYKHDVEKSHPLTHILQGKVLVTLFYEVSSRMPYSFQAAMQRLGGSVIAVDSETSSGQKEETLEDTVQILGGYEDITVLRSKENGEAERAALVFEQPVINGGDGTGEHPTQALLDVYTIRQEMGTVNGLTIALVGDLKNGRTVHSLAKLLCLYKDVTLHYIAPTDDLQMPQDVLDYVSSHSNFTQKKFSTLAEGISHVDVVYVTRIQKERFPSAEDYEKVKGSYIINAKLLNEAARDMDEELQGNLLVPARSLPIVMHPLPRVDEIAVELDHDERAAYFRQAKNGMFVRMSILSLLLGRGHL